jgi:hypothetical protein
LKRQTKPGNYRTFATYTLLSPLILYFRHLYFTFATYTLLSPLILYFRHFYFGLNNFCQFFFEFHYLNSISKRSGGDCHRSTATATAPSGMGSVASSPRLTQVQRLFELRVRFRFSVAPQGGTSAGPSPRRRATVKLQVRSATVNGHGPQWHGV